MNTMLNYLKDALNEKPLVDTITNGLNKAALTLYKVIATLSNIGLVIGMIVIIYYLVNTFISQAKTNDPEQMKRNKQKIVWMVIGFLIIATLFGLLVVWQANNFKFGSK